MLTVQPMRGRDQDHTETRAAAPAGPAPRLHVWEIADGEATVRVRAAAHGHVRLAVVISGRIEAQLRLLPLGVSHDHATWEEGQPPVPLDRPGIAREGRAVELTHDAFEAVVAAAVTAERWLSLAPEPALRAPWRALRRGLVLPPTAAPPSVPAALAARAARAAAIALFVTRCPEGFAAVRRAAGASAPRLAAPPELEAATGSLAAWPRAEVDLRLALARVGRRVAHLDHGLAGLRGQRLREASEGLLELRSDLLGLSRWVRRADALAPARRLAVGAVLSGWTARVDQRLRYVADGAWGALPDELDPLDEVELREEILAGYRLEAGRLRARLDQCARACAPGGQQVYYALSEVVADAGRRRAELVAAYQRAGHPEAEWRLGARPGTLDLDLDATLAALSGWVAAVRDRQVRAA